MPKLPVNKRRNAPFDGQVLYKFDKLYLFPKIVFTVCGDDLKIVFSNPRNKFIKDKSLVVENFKQKTANHVKSLTDGGRHFEDGIHEIWKYFGLDLGYTIKYLRDLHR